MNIIFSKNPILYKSPLNQANGNVYFKGKNDPSKLPETLNCLKYEIPDIEQFWQGQVFLSDINGNPAKINILPVSPDDAFQIDHWYKADTNTKPAYIDQKWHDWWIDKIRNGESGCKIIKAEHNGVILGVMLIRLSLKNYSDGNPITLIRGLRVSPSCNGKLNTHTDFGGTGTALLTYAVAESIKAGTTGIGINSSIGAEGFYEKTLGKSKGLAYDSKRQFFRLSGDDRTGFLKTQYKKYQNLKNRH